MNFLRRVINGEVSSNEKDGREPEAEPEPVTAGVEETYPLPSAHDLQVGMASDPGRVRDHNEDASFVWQCMFAEQGQPPLPMGLFIIADGMGGHAQGEKASAISAKLAADHIIRQVCLPTLAVEDDASGPAPINEILEESVHRAHRAVSREIPEGGTTLTITLVLGDSVYVAHVGDSRLYVGERGSLQILTQDHSVAARLVELGQATAEEAASQRNVLYKAVGQGATIEPDILYCDLEVGQYLLLCCDGLWGKVSDDEIAAIVEAAPTADIACQNLVAKANENGGDDNISVILAARGWPLPVRQGAG